MAQPTQLRYYMTNLTANSSSLPGPGSLGISGHGALTASVPSANATTAFGWNMGSLTAPRYVLMDFAAEVVRTATQPTWQTTPTGSGPRASIGDCWVAGPFNGDFESGSWQITQSLKSVTTAGPQLGRFIYTIYKSPNIQGSSSVGMTASLVSGQTSQYISSSITPSLAATTTQNLCTASFGLPAMTFKDEWLLIQVQFNLTTAGNANNCDADWIIGEKSASVLTAHYTAYDTRGITVRDDE